MKKLIVFEWLLNTFMALLLLAGACLLIMELPRAIDREESAYQARIMSRCVQHGEYNMADAFCRAASKDAQQ